MRTPSRSEQRYKVIRRRLPVWLLVVPLSLWAVVELYPIIFMIVNGLKSEAQYVQRPFSIPFPPDLSRILNVWNGGRMGIPISRYFLNSLIVTSLSLLSVSFVSITAGWSLARFQYPGKRVLQGLFTAALAVPVHATLIPVFIMLGRMGLRNSFPGIVAVYTAFWVPFSVIVLRAGFMNFPKELIESALIDGCTEFSSFSKIVVPLSMGSISSLAIVNGVGIWSELLYAFILMNQPTTRTLTVGLLAFKGEYIIEWTQIFAGLSIASVPIIVLFIFFQSKITKGMMLGAFK